MTIDIIIPTLNRAHKLAAVAANIDEVTKTPHRTLFVVEPDDIASQLHCWANGLNCMISGKPGNHTGAANSAYLATSGEYIMIANDDFFFHPEWDTRAIEKLTGNKQVVGVNDMGGANTCTSIFLFKRIYIQEMSGCIDVKDVVFYPGYNHQYVDNEFWETAEGRGVFTSCPESHVEHMHPGFGKAAKDETYKKADSKTQEDQTTYRARRHLWS